MKRANKFLLLGGVTLVTGIGLMPVLPLFELTRNLTPVIMVPIMFVAFMFAIESLKLSSKTD